MPTITIYLSNELYDKVRDAPSKTVRAALESYFKDQDGKSTDTSEDSSRDATRREGKLIF
jgi:hypothetical protein